MKRKHWREWVRVRWNEVEVARDVREEEEGRYGCCAIMSNETGEVERRFDSTVPSERANLEVSATPEAKTRGEFTVACFNPTGDTVVLGNWNSFYSYTYNQRQDSWEEIGPKHIQNLYAITSLAWKHDGGRLAVGVGFASFLCIFLHFWSIFVPIEATYA